MKEALSVWPTAALVLCIHVNSFAQPVRITGLIDDGERVTLRGHLHRQAQSLYDQGRAESYLRIERLTLVLKPSDAQTAELDRLLGELQYPKSGIYHQWLTPESYADRFGLNQGDIAKIVEWLSAKQLTVTGVSRARNAIMFRGRAEQIESAFQTRIYIYNVAGEMHYANATEPSVPQALEGIVLAIHGLHDFRLRPANPIVQMLLATQGEASPDFPTDNSGKRYLTPEDFARNADSSRLVFRSGADSSPYSVAVVGQSQIDTSHLSAFRRKFNLGDAHLIVTLVPNTQDPGTRMSDERQSNRDLAWASVLARRAGLHFVYSNDVMDAVQYAVDENLAPILGISYGECATSSLSDVQTMRSWARQARAQGITWASASGDSGAGGCYQSSLGQ
jgi:subtilase family serine protease